jgi:hypothetical protein
MEIKILFALLILITTASIFAADFLYFSIKL